MSLTNRFLQIALAAGLMINPINAKDNGFVIDKNTMSMSFTIGSHQNKAHDLILELSDRYHTNTSMRVEVRAPNAQDIDLDRIANILAHAQPLARESVTKICFLSREHFAQIAALAPHDVWSSSGEYRGFTVDTLIAINLDERFRPALEEVLSHELAHAWQNALIEKKLQTIVDQWPKQVAAQHAAVTILDSMNKIEKDSVALKKRFDTLRQIYEKLQADYDQFRIEKKRIEESTTYSPEKQAYVNTKIAEFVKRSEAYGAEKKSCEKDQEAYTVAVREFNQLQRQTGATSIYGNRNELDDMAETVAMILHKPEQFASLLREDTTGAFKKKLELCKKFDIVSKKAIAVVEESVKRQK